MEKFVISEILDSTSSSSDDEIIAEICANISSTEVPKIKNYMDVIENYCEDQFRRSFRMRRITVEYLSNKYENSKFFPRINHGGSEVIPALQPFLQQILSFIWFAGNKCSIRDVAERFGIGMTTFFRQQTRIIDFMLDIAPEIIKFPKTEEQKRQAAEDFLQISGFPNVIGCIDGTSIPIRTPAGKIKSTYVNRHDIASITLQGICDSRKAFIDVFTGPPGKIHDSRIFKLSFISKEVPVLCGQEFHLLGDSAYPLREYLITPFRDYGNLTEEQKSFNKTLSASRVLIENTFGLLKGRWRQLLQLDFMEVDKISSFIVACCVLHNLCILNDDLWDLNSEDNNCSEIGDNIDGYADSEHEQRQLGEIKRSRLCQYLVDN